MRSNLEKIKKFDQISTLEMVCDFENYIEEYLPILSYEIWFICQDS